MRKMLIVVLVLSSFLINAVSIQEAKSHKLHCNKRLLSESKQDLSSQRFLKISSTKYCPTYKFQEQGFSSCKLKCTGSNKINNANLMLNSIKGINGNYYCVPLEGYDKIK